MKKRTRYLLIALCFVAFLVLAPTMVFFIRGIRPGAGADQYQQTGILVVNSEPKHAKVFLNDIERDTTPATIRFLTPAEYVITLKSLGYFDWTKRLEVKANKVAWAMDNIPVVSLIRQDNHETQVATGASDFVLRNSSIIYLSGSNLVMAPVSHPERTDNLLVPHPVSHITELVDRNVLLLSGENSVLLFSISDKIFYDLAGLIKPDQRVELSSDGMLLVLDQKSLVLIDPKTKKKTILLKNISAFTLLNRDLYYLTADASSSLRTVPLAQADSTEGTLVFSNVPAAQDARIVVSPQREVALVLDNTLYRVNGSLERIADDLTGWSVNTTDDLIVFTTPAELAYYSFSGNAEHLVTRNTADIHSPFVSAKIGYAFFIENKQLHALELDARDHQNDYTIASIGVPGRIVPSDDLKRLYVQHGTGVTQYTIR